MAEHVKSEISKSVETTVYSAGQPTMYHRRGENGNFLGSGSLGDPNEMDYQVNNGVLKVVDNADRSSDYNPGYGYDESKSLAYNIEFGWGNKDEWYSKARPFMTDAKENMQKTNSHVKVMKDGLKKRLGANVVK
jgi:hypothetical protein